VGRPKPAFSPGSQLSFLDLLFAVQFDIFRDVGDVKDKNHLHHPPIPIKVSGGGASALARLSWSVNKANTPFLLAE